jgi:hypothetical protein
MRVRLAVGALIVQMLLLFSPDRSWAVCISPPLSAEALDKFRSDPDSIVAGEADTRTVESTIRDIAGTDASLAADLINVARHASPRMQTAIAAGLAQAALACSGQDPPAAQLIQEAVASFQDGPFQAVFAAVAGDLSTAATAAAASFASSSVGSSVAVGQNSSSRGPTGGGGGGVTTFFQITATGLALGNAAGLASTAADPVSPVQ